MSSLFGVLNTKKPSLVGDGFQRQKRKIWENLEGVGEVYRDLSDVTEVAAVICYKVSGLE